MNYFNNNFKFRFENISKFYKVKIFEYNNDYKY